MAFILHQGRFISTCFNVIVEFPWDQKYVAQVSLLLYEEANTEIIEIHRIIMQQSKVNLPYVWRKHGLLVSDFDAATLVSYC